MSNIERAEWAEGKFKEWKEMYIIPFQQEFNVKALLDLQWQYNNTDDNHIKSKRDLIETITRLQRDLSLKPVSKEIKDKSKVLFITNGFEESTHLLKMFVDMIGNDNIRKMRTNELLETDNLKVEIMSIKSTATLDKLRGKKYDHYYNLCNNEKANRKILEIIKQ